MESKKTISTSATQISKQAIAVISDKSWYGRNMLPTIFILLQEV